MPIFRRVLRWLFFLAGFVAALIGGIATFFAMRLIRPPRQRLWTTPSDLGMSYESVQFPAQDGVSLSGWFIPARPDSKRKGSTIVMVHGWPWNRLGEAATDLLSSLNGSTPVDLLRLTHALHHDGYHVLMFDLRNHGESGTATPVTFGWQELKDLLGALAYLNRRPEVDPERIGAIGFSMGANTVLYTLPQTRQIKAAVAVQPTSVTVFAGRFAADMLGIVGKVVLPLTQWMYQMAGGLPFAELRPSAAASGAGDVPVLYVQGSGDKWGSMADVSQMAAVTPRPSGPLFPETTHRFEGYQYVIDNPKIVLAFFEQHLPE